MDNYIKLLLENHSLLILPDFGALIVTDDDKKSFFFNEFIKYDDGKLAAFVEQQSTMDLQEAKNAVAKFVRELKAKLDKGEEYDIYGLGSFSKNKDNEYTFENVPTPTDSPSLANENQTKESAETQETATPSLSEILEGKKTKEIEEIEEEIPAEEEEIIDHEEETVAEKENTDTLESDFTEKTEEKAEENLEIEEQEEEIEQETDRNEQNETTEPVETESLVEKKKRGFLFWFLMCLLVLLIGGGVVMALNYEKIENYMGWNKFENPEKKTDSESATDNAPLESPEVEEQTEETPITEVESEQETSQTETTASTETQETPKSVEPAPKVQPTQKNTVITNPEGTNYYVIAGTFSELKNAENLVGSFSENGVTLSIIGQFNGMYYVGSKPFSSFSEAKKELPQISAVMEGAWIFKNQ